MTGDEVGTTGRWGPHTAGVGANPLPQHAPGGRKQKSRATQRKPGCKEETGADPQRKAGMSIHVATAGPFPITMDLRCASLLFATGLWD